MVSRKKIYIVSIRRLNELVSSEFSYVITVFISLCILGVYTTLRHFPIRACRRQADYLSSHPGGRPCGAAGRPARDRLRSPARIISSARPSAALQLSLTQIIARKILLRHFVISHRHKKFEVKPCLFI